MKSIDIGLSLEYIRIKWFKQNITKYLFQTAGRMVWTLGSEKNSLLLLKPSQSAGMVAAGGMS